MAAGPDPSLPGEWREIVLHRRADAPEAELYVTLEPSMIGEKDYAAHPSFARLGICTRREDGVLLVRRLARGALPEQYLALFPPAAADVSCRTRAGRASASYRRGYVSPRKSPTVG